MGIAYVVVAWLIIQVVDVVINNIGAPDWVFRVVLLLLAVGLPVIMLFAWAFEMTPEGLKLEKQVDRSKSIVRQTGRKLDLTIIAVLTLALGYFVVDKFVISDDQPGEVPAVVAEAQLSEDEEVAGEQSVERIAQLMSRMMPVQIKTDHLS